MEIGSGPKGIINHINKSERYALDPLTDYYKNTFKLSEEIKWLKGIGEDIPFKNDYFDAVISTNTLDHTFNPQKVLEEINVLWEQQR